MASPGAPFKPFGSASPAPSPGGLAFPGQRPAGAGAGGGLVLPGQVQPGQWPQAQKQTMPGTPGGANYQRPSAGPSGAATPAGDEKTDFDTLNDALGMSGVDIGAEEELARLQSLRQRYASAPQVRVRVPEFVERPALTTMVQHIAASYQLKTLEPAILEVLAQAAEARIRALAEAAVEAKNHRIGASHLRPPPLYPADPFSKGKRKRLDYDDDEAELDEVKRKPMYDQVVYDDQERLLAVMARVEAEEERAARKARMDRDLDESAKAEAAASASAGAGGALGDGSAGPGTPSTPSGAEGKPKKEKKSKKQGPSVTAKNLSEDARARQSNQTAMRSVGGPSRYSWLSGGGGAAAGAGSFTPASRLPGSAAGTPGLDGPKGLPAPKFAPAPPTFASVSSLPRPGFPDGTSRLGGPLPGPHEAVGGIGLAGRPESANVTVRDATFALERERGTGAGRGTGTKALYRAYAFKV